ncbi:filamentous hemagglutinin N-terminal domain-containing protein, partial [Psittacicella hinzii]
MKKHQYNTFIKKIRNDHKVNQISQILLQDTDSTPAKGIGLKDVNNMLVAASFLVGVPALANANTVETPKTATTATLVSKNDLNVNVDTTQSTALNVENVNNVPVINIENPNNAGVSDNRFSNFSTNTGAVFKNNTVAVDSSVLKQKLAANPNLKEAAKVILAQVTGNNKSVIKGTLEVLGQKADLLIINPNGIDLNGVNLVNTRDFTAATAEVNANNYDAMDVRRGEINVNGDLTTDDVNVLKLIAHAVQVKAKIAPSKKNKKAADIVISAGKQKFDHKTNTATAVDTSAEEPRVAISGDALGSMYGNKVNFIVTESGAGVEFDGLVLGDDNIAITADGQIKVNQVISDKDVQVASKNADVTTKGLVTGKNTSVKGKRVFIEADSLVNAEQQTTLSASEKVELSGQVHGDNVLLSATDFDTNEQASVSATKATIEYTQGVESADKFATLNKIASQTSAGKVALKTTNVTVNQGENVTVSAVNEFVVTDTFKNHGILSLEHRLDLDTDESILVSTGKNFENYGVLLAHNLGVKSTKNINLAGATFIYNDALLLAQNVEQSGALAVGGNLTVIADQFNVNGTLNGEAKIDTTDSITASHYADWRLRRDLYNITTQFGKVNLDGVTVNGGKLNVKGNLIVVGLAYQDQETLNQFTDNSEVVSLNDNKLDFNARNASISVGEDLTVIGDVTNKVDTIQVPVADLLKRSGKVTFSFQPRTWINTGLMRAKVQTFDSVYDLFQGLFGNSKNFSWRNGAYQIKGEYVLDTLREGFTDTYSQQLMSTVFGSDWKFANFNTLKDRWNNFLAKENNLQVTFYAAGGQLSVGGNYTQTGGDLYVGTDRNLYTVDTKTNKDYSINLARAGLSDSKVTRTEAASLVNLNAEIGAEVNDLISSATAEFNNVSEIKDFSTIADGLPLDGDNTTLALNVLQQVKDQTGNYLLKSASATEVINELITNTARYNKKLAELNAWYQEKVDSNLTVKTKEFYTKQYEVKLNRLNTQYDQLTFVKNADGTYAPSLKLSSKTQRIVTDYALAAAIVETGNDLSVTEAESITTNNAMLKGKNVTLEAPEINLEAAANGNAVIAEEATVINADNFKLLGNAKLGNLTLFANNAELSSKGALDSKGNQTLSGTATAKNAEVVVTGELALNAYKVLVENNATYTAESLNLLGDTVVGSSYAKEDVAGAVGTTETKKVAASVVGSELTADNLVIYTDYMHTQSAKVNAHNKAEITVTEDLLADTISNYEETKTHTETIKVGASANADFGGYKGSASVSLADNNGTAKVEGGVVRDKNTTGKAGAGFSISYSVVDTTSSAKVAENNKYNAQDLTINVGGTAELGNTDINVDTASKEPAKAVINANKVTSEQVQNTYTETTKSHSVGFSIGSTISSPGVTSLSNVVSNIATAVEQGSELNSTFGMLTNVAKNAMNIVQDPSASIGIKTGLEANWSNTSSKEVVDNRNNYKGDLTINAQDSINLKAVNGHELNNLSLTADNVSIEGGVSPKEVSTKEGGFKLGLETGIVADKTGVNAKIAGTLAVTGEFADTSEQNVRSSELNVKNLEINAEATKLEATTIEAEKADINTQTLDVISKQNTFDGHKTNFTIGATAAVSISPTGAVTPSGSFNTTVSHEVTKSEITENQAGITAKELNVKAEQIALTGGTLIAQETSDISAQVVNAVNLKEFSYTDGGKGGLAFAFDENGVKSITPSAGRLENTHLKQTTHASIIADNVNVEFVDGELNTDIAKLQEVNSFEANEAKNYTFTIDANFEEKVKTQVKDLKNKVVTVANKLGLNLAGNTTNTTNNT